MKSDDDVNNFRPITIIPILSKLFESCLVNLYVPYLGTHYNQFGFVEYGGCDKALFAVKFVISYFLSYNLPVFVSSLDGEKAFDRINHYD